MDEEAPNALLTTTGLCRLIDEILPPEHSSPATLSHFSFLFVASCRSPLLFDCPYCIPAPTLPYSGAPYGGLSNCLWSGVPFLSRVGCPRRAHYRFHNRTGACAAMVARDFIGGLALYHCQTYNHHHHHHHHHRRGAATPPLSDRRQHRSHSPPTICFVHGSQARSQRLTVQQR